MENAIDSVNNRRYRKVRPSGIVVNIIIGFFALAMLFPFYWMVVGSFLPDAMVTRIPPLLFPQSFYTFNYQEIFRRAPAWNWLFNSILVSSLTSFLVVTVSSMAGYSFAKKKFFLRDIIFYIMVATIMVPRQIMVVPLFRIIYNLDLFNNHWGLILPFLGWPIGVFMLKQFMVTLPTEIIDAARIDGCGEISTFLRIIIPLAKPGIGALAIFTFVNSWNDYMWQLLIMSSRTLLTLPLGVATFQEEFSARLGLQMAGGVLAALPMVVVFLMFQKHFTKGITLGSVKG